MNRIQYMTELASLLQDIPEVERRDAMQYYNDYFDEAGEENEQQVIEELGSPVKVAQNIKADLSGKSDEEYSEYRETGYTDTRFEQKDIPAGRQPEGGYTYGQNGGYAGGQSSYEQNSQNTQKSPWTNKTLKIILIVAIVLVASPIWLPLIGGLLAVVAGLIIAAFAVFIGLVVASLIVLIMGIILIGIGIAAFIPETAVGFALTGSGLIMGVLGLIATVGSVKLCMVVFPAICRGLVWLCRKPFHRKAVG